MPLLPWALRGLAPMTRLVCPGACSVGLAGVIEAAPGLEGPVAILVRDEADPADGAHSWP
jgi:hypothetical protein